MSFVAHVVFCVSKNVSFSGTYTQDNLEKCRGFNRSFYKQKTAYEMRISYCSSDVCSSDLMQISDILSVEGADSFTRPIYAGNAIATVTTSDTKLVLTVRTTAFDKASPEGDRKSTRLNSSH